ncbi:hypothetical protein LSAT2_033096 [Lamellibrachia satsuma]|nr:hypothetical protein LSAT2_033096 [Lamellibrachia satsuma]
MTDSECENLALGKVATMSEDQDHNYAMLAVDGNKYEPDMCVTLTSRSNKLMWWSVNLGHEYVVGFVNIYYYTTKCVVTRFEPTSKRLRKPKNHFASFYVELNMCKWLCESYKNCTGIDFNNDKDSTSATECYIHTRGISSIDREQRGHRSYTFLGVTRNCKTPRRDKPSISNWASLSGQPNIYKRVVAFRVTISISVQTKRSTSVSTRNACVHNRIYTFTGAVSIKCDQTVLGRHVSISSRQKLPVIFSEVEIFVDEFPQNIALGKVADSSATIGMGTPYDAIDGSIILEDIKEHIPIPGASYPTKKVKEYWWLVVLDKNKVHIGYIFIYLKKKDQVNIRSFIVGFKQSTTYKATDGICGYVGSKKSTVAIHKCDEYTKAPIVFVGKGDGSYVDLVEVEVFEYKSVMCHEEESGNGYVRKHLPVIIR